MNSILLFQSTTGKSWRDKLSGVYRFAREKKWFVQVVNRFSTPREILRALKEWRPVGCLVDRAMDKGAPPDRLFGSLPVVYLDQNPARPSSIHPLLVHDSAGCAIMAADELFKQGLASCAYLGMSRPYFWDAERQTAFVQKAKAVGCKVTVLDRRNLRTKLRSLPKPCGVLAANDQCALEVYHAATAARLSIPDDVAIVGIDNDEICCESVSPGITSVEPDFSGAGYKMSQMLETEICLGVAGRSKRKQPPFATYSPLRLVRRGTTSAIPSADPRVRRAIEFIRRHACERALRIDDILPMMDCSRRLATMRFKQATGHSILAEIHDCRFARICEMLTGTNWPISTVIAQSGYVSSSFAHKMFRSRTGHTMLAWRRSRQLKDRPILRSDGPCLP